MSCGTVGRYEVRFTDATGRRGRTEFVRPVGEDRAMREACWHIDHGHRDVVVWRDGEPVWEQPRRGRREDS